MAQAPSSELAPRLQGPSAAAAARLGARRTDRVLALCYFAAEAWTLCSLPPCSSSRYATQLALLVAQAVLLTFFLGASWDQWQHHRATAIAALRLSAAVAHARMLYGTQVRGRYGEWV